MSAKRLFLLDGHALVYRAHFAFIARPLINSKGINTSAVNGFTRTPCGVQRMECDNRTRYYVAHAIQDYSRDIALCAWLEWAGVQRRRRDRPSCAPDLAW